MNFLDHLDALRVVKVSVLPSLICETVSDSLTMNGRLSGSGRRSLFHNHAWVSASSSKEASSIVFHLNLLTLVDCIGERVLTCLDFPRLQKIIESRT